MITNDQIGNHLPVLKNPDETGPEMTGTMKKSSESPESSGVSLSAPAVVSREIREIPGRAREVISHINGWQEHLSGRLRKKMTGFDHRIAGFPQRRWS
jgi:hypothetical protein